MYYKLIFVLASSITLTVAVLGQTSPAAEQLVITPVNRNATVPLLGNTPGIATAKNDRGPLPDDMPIADFSLLLRRPAAREAALHAYIEEAQTSGSPLFHKWLTATQLGANYGPAPEDVSAVTDWLQSEGFTVNTVFPSGNLIDISGTAGMIRTAFHTELHYVRVRGELHFANMQDPSVPAALAPVIIGIPSLTDYHPQPQDTRVSTTGVRTYDMAPADMQTIYNLTPIYAAGVSGQGQTIAVIENSDVYSTSDFYAYRRSFGLAKAFPQGNIVVSHPDCADPGYKSVAEPTLDSQMATAIAPNATIIEASCPNTTESGNLIALRNLLNGSHPPSVVSNSLGQSEAEAGAARNAFTYSLYQQAASEGVSVFVSAGDHGPDDFPGDRGEISTHGLNVNQFASTPYNVAVGGTDFEDTYLGENALYWSAANTAQKGSALSYVPEIPWNSSCASPLLAAYNGYATAYGANGYCNSPNVPSGVVTNGAGSGGPSSCATGVPATRAVVGGSCAGWPKPSWQTVPGNPSDGVRDLPDVSLFAANGAWKHTILLCYSDPNGGGNDCAANDYFKTGGTSASAPMMAAIQLLIDQQTGQQWGNPNPIYYALANAQFSSAANSNCDASLGNAINPACVFHDITQATNQVVCQAGSPYCYAPSGAVGVFSLSTTSYIPAYSAGVGWDFTTGLGSVNAYMLMMNWSTGVQLMSEKAAARLTGANPGANQ